MSKMNKSSQGGKSHLKLVKSSPKKAARLNIYKSRSGAQPMFSDAHLGTKGKRFRPHEHAQPSNDSNRNWLRDWSPFFATLILTAVVWFFVGYYLVKIANIGG